MSKNSAAKVYQNMCQPTENTKVFQRIEQMFIKNDTITLRCAEPEDAEQIFRWENDRDIWRVSGTHVPYSRFQIEQFLLSSNDLPAQKQLRMMIDLTESGQTIGCVDIYDYDAFNSRAGLGILIDKEYRQQGYAKAALALCIEYLFHDVLLHQVYCSIDETNTESQQLFLGLGFELCGRRKDWIKSSEGYLDVFEYQLISKGIVKATPPLKGAGGINLTPTDRFSDFTPEYLQQYEINTDNLIFVPFNLPYNPNLKQRSRNLRNDCQLSEKLLWNQLKGKQTGYTFNRQKPILNYIADLYCKELDLVIEIDGASHFSKEAQEYDEERDRQMQVLGLNVIRVLDSEVRKNPELVAKSIMEQVLTST